MPLRKVLKKAAAKAQHGTRIRYLDGCRCENCKHANARYHQERRAARRIGLGNKLVPAARVRRHLARLSRLGIGRKTIGDASGVSDNTIQAVKSGRKRRIRQRVERAILGVSAAAIGDACLVPGEKAWGLIDRLLALGYRKADLARRLGYEDGRLRFTRDRVTAKTQLRIERLFGKLMSEGRKGVERR
jgi:hypothetical protein